MLFRSALAAAIENAGLVQAHAVEVSAREVAGVGAADVRGPDGRGGMVLEVPDLGPDRPQVLLLADEQGVLSWHFPQPAERSPAGSVQFVVPREVARAEQLPGTAPAEQRGLVAVVGKKLLSVFVFPIVERIVGEAAEILAARYERASRPYGLRRLVAGQHRVAGAGAFDGSSWQQIGAGRALLFLHGTFSTSHSGFGGLPDDAVGTLAHAYGDRLVAFDHPTLSVTPADNARELLSRIPPGMRIDADVVTHSRGGLVARALADQVGDRADAPIRIRRIVFVATPNAGTALADPNHLGALIDRYTTMLNLIPDGPWSVVTDVLDGVLTVVKILGQSAVGGLPGLQAMNPGDGSLAILGDTSATDIEYYAIDADYEPTGSLARLVRVTDAVVDRVFDTAANDIVVPTGGVSSVPGRPGFPVSAQRQLHFDKTREVWHCSYFSRPETATMLSSWCTG